MSRAQKILESVEIASGVRVSKNPRSLERLYQECRKDFEHRTDKDEWRILVFFETGEVFIWDAYKGTHANMCGQLGLDPADTVSGGFVIDPDSNTPIAERGLYLRTGWISSAHRPMLNEFEKKLVSVLGHPKSGHIFQ